MKFVFTILTVFSGVSYVAAQKTAEVIEHDATFEIKKIETLNSEYRETNLSITPDGKHHFFMSDRGEQPWSQQYGKYNGQKVFDGDIWFSNRMAKGWSDPMCLDSTINSASGDDEPMISPDGQMVTFQSWKDDWKQTGGPYYQAELSGSNWSDLTGLSGGINRFFIGNFNRSEIGYATDGASMSPDGKTFIVACGEDYDGELDIYLSQKADGQWRFPKKASISTEGDERSVFIAGDGQTVYFASDGYEGFGGLDIYKTTLHEDGSFGNVMNVGKPFNTKEDDYGFIVAASGEEAFFVRNGDIYSVAINSANPDLKPTPVLIISGTVKDTKGNFIEAHLNLIDTKKKKVVATSKSNSETGQYSFSTLQQSTTYQIQDTDSARIDTTFSVESTGSYQEMELNLSVKKPETEARVKQTETAHESKPEKKTFNTVAYFAFDKATLTTATKAKLDALVDSLTNSTDYKIEITGHTDSKGTEAYNQKLGLERAKAAKAYLVQKGVDPARISIKSSGESEPVGNNETEKGRRENRRVGVTITN